MGAPATRGRGGESAVSEALPEVVDLAFPVQGRELPRAHRAPLAAALERALPWLADEPLAAVHRLNVVAGGGAGGPSALLSSRTRLTLRLPRERVRDALALQGAVLDVGELPLRLGMAQEREVLPFGTQYAHFVAAGAAPGAGDESEAVFLAGAEAALAALGVNGRAICGRRQTIEGGFVERGREAATLAGYSLMVDGLAREGALRLLAAGLGSHRRWGCGVFVPHKSAAAVGAAN
jgi:CRISPR-associated protein Cas6